MLPNVHINWLHLTNVYIAQPQTIHKSNRIDNINKIITSCGILQQSTVIEKACSWVKIYVPSELVGISACVDLYNLKLSVSSLM